MDRPPPSPVQTLENKDLIGAKVPRRREEGVPGVRDESAPFAGLPLDKISLVADSMRNGRAPSPETPSSERPSLHPPGAVDFPVTPAERSSPEWHLDYRAAKVVSLRLYPGEEERATDSLFRADEAFRDKWPVLPSGLTALDRRSRDWLGEFDNLTALDLKPSEARAAADAWYVEFRLTPSGNSHPHHKDPPVMLQIEPVALGAEPSPPSPPKRRGRPPGSGAKPKASPPRIDAEFEDDGTRPFSNPDLPPVKATKAKLDTDQDKELRKLRAAASAVTDLLEHVAPWRRQIILSLASAEVAALDAHRRAGNELAGRGLDAPHGPRLYSHPRNLENATLELRDELRRALAGFDALIGLNVGVE